MKNALYFEKFFSKKEIFHLFFPMVLFPADIYERVLFVQLFLLRGRIHFSDQLGEMKKAGQLVQFHLFSVLHNRHCRTAASAESGFLLRSWFKGRRRRCRGAQKALNFRDSLFVVEKVFFFFLCTHVSSTGCSVHYTYPRGHKPPAGVVGSSL